MYVHKISIDTWFFTSEVVERVLIRSDNTNANSLCLSTHDLHACLHFSFAAQLVTERRDVSFGTDSGDT